MLKEQKRLKCELRALNAFKRKRAIRKSLSASSASLNNYPMNTFYQNSNSEPNNCNVLSKKITDPVQGAYFITNASLSNHPIVYASPSFFDLTGYVENEVLGQPSLFFNSKRTDTQVVEFLHECITSGLDCSCKLFVNRSDETFFRCQLFTSMIRNVHDEVTNMICILVPNQLDDGNVLASSRPSISMGLVDTSTSFASCNTTATILPHQNTLEMLSCISTEKSCARDEQSINEGLQNCTEDNRKSAKAHNACDSESRRPKRVLSGRDLSMDNLIQGPPIPVPTDLGFSGKQNDEHAPSVSDNTNIKINNMINTTTPTGPISTATNKEQAAVGRNCKKIRTNTSSNTSGNVALTQQQQQIVPQDASFNVSVSSAKHVIQRGICAICIQFESRMAGVVVTEEYLRILLCLTNNILSMRIIRSIFNRQTGIHKGVVFIHFESSAAGVDSALYCSNTLFTVRNAYVDFLVKVLVSNESFSLVNNGELFYFSSSDLSSLTGTSSCRPHEDSTFLSEESSSKFQQQQQCSNNNTKISNIPSNSSNTASTTSGTTTSTISRPNNAIFSDRSVSWEEELFEDYPSSLQI